MTPSIEPEAFKKQPREEHASLLDGQSWSSAGIQANAVLLTPEEDPQHLSPARLTYQNLEVQADVDEGHVIKRVNWHLLPIFFALALLCSIDRANLSFAALQMNHDLHFSKAVYGMGSGVFFLGYATFAIPSTFACAWMGAPSFLGGILVIWGLTASLFSAMTRQWQFYVLRFLLGLAESGAYPAMWYHLALFYTERELGLAYTIVATASSLSGVVGGPLAAAILKLDGALGLHGWQWLFMLEGIPAVLLGIAIRLHLARTPAVATFLEPAERAWLASRKQDAEAVGAKPGADEEVVLLEAGGREDYLAAFLRMLREWRIWWLGAIWALTSVGIDGLVFWIPLLIKAIYFGDVDDEGEDGSELKERAIQSALASTVPFTVAAASMVLVAWLSKRAGERRRHIAVPLLISMASLITLPLVEGHVTWLAFLMLTCAAGGIWSVHGPLFSWPAALLNGTAAASGFALVKMLGSLAAFVGNLMIGELHEATGSFNVPMWLMAGLMGTAALLALCLNEPGGPGHSAASMPILTRLQNRLNMKRSRSDPVSLSPDYPTAPSITGSFRPLHGYQLFEPDSLDASLNDITRAQLPQVQRLHVDPLDVDDAVELQLTAQATVPYPTLDVGDKAGELAPTLSSHRPPQTLDMHTARHTD